MSQINVNTPEPVAPSGDRTAAAGINLITVLVVVVVLAVVAWYLFTGPLHSMTSGPSDTTVNVNTPAINVNPPSAPAAPAPANNSNTGTNNAPAPAKP